MALKTNPASTRWNPILPGAQLCRMHAPIVVRSGDRWMDSIIRHWSTPEKRIQRKEAREQRGRAGAAAHAQSQCPWTLTRTCAVCHFQRKQPKNIRVCKPNRTCNMSFPRQKQQVRHCQCRCKIVAGAACSKRQAWVSFGLDWDWMRKRGGDVDKARRNF
jgi:hypothetical protein